MLIVPHLEADTQLDTREPNYIPVIDEGEPIMAYKTGMCRELNASLLGSLSYEKEDGYVNIYGINSYDAREFDNQVINFHMRHLCLLGWEGTKYIFSNGDADLYSIMHNVQSGRSAYDIPDLGNIQLLAEDPPVLDGTEAGSSYTTDSNYLRIEPGMQLPEPGACLLKVPLEWCNYIPITSFLMLLPRLWRRLYTSRFFLASTFRKWVPDDSVTAHLAFPDAHTKGVWKSLVGLYLMPLQVSFNTNPKFWTWMRLWIGDAYGSFVMERKTNYTKSVNLPELMRRGQEAEQVINGLETFIETIRPFHEATEEFYKYLAMHGLGGLVVPRKTQ